MATKTSQDNQEQLVQQMNIKANSFVEATNGKIYGNMMLGGEKVRQAPCERVS